MATFALGRYARDVHRRNAGLVRAADDEQATGPTPLAASPGELRGVPIVGRGVEGAIRNTQPAAVVARY